MDICILALEHGAEPLVAGDPSTTTIVASTPTLELTTLAGVVLADTWATVWSAGTASDAKVRQLMRRVPLTTTAEAHRN